jgi:hypothetical protein
MKNAVFWDVAAANCSRWFLALRENLKSLRRYVEIKANCIMMSYTSEHLYPQFHLDVRPGLSEGRGIVPNYFSGDNVGASYDPDPHGTGAHGLDHNSTLFSSLFQALLQSPRGIRKTAQCSHFYSIDAAWIIFIRDHVTQAQGNKCMGGVATALIPHPNLNLGCYWRFGIVRERHKFTKYVPLK